jgi:GNAT superfamily N-acetyltransferase
MGPATFSTNSEIGLLVKGFEYPPMILTSHAPKYSQGFVEGAGYMKSMDLFCYLVDGNDWGGKKADKIPERLTRVIDKIRERRNFKVRPVNMSDFDNEIAKVKVIYNQAWEKNWGFVPLSDVEINKMATDLKQMIDPKIALFIEVGGEPVAFAVPLPNVYQPLRAARMKPGEPEILQLLRLIWHWKVKRDLNSVRAWALGILEEYRGSGVDALLYYELLTRGLPRGYTTIEMSWILENNVMMNRGCQMMGGEVYKIYRVYEKALA